MEQDISLEEQEKTEEAGMNKDEIELIQEIAERICEGSMTREEFKIWLDGYVIGRKHEEIKRKNEK